ncbi:hypothetical protein CR513_22075, partial [Mucuna pruriens]
MDWSMIDATSGGGLMDKMPTAARHLISNMFGVKRASQPQMANEIGAVDNLRLENQLTELTSLVRQLAVGQHQPSIIARVCGICTSVDHPTDMCPTLQDTELDYPESVGAIGGYQHGKQTYQRPTGYQQSTPQYQTPPFQQQQQRMPAQGNSPSLEDLMKQLIASNLEFQQTMSSSNMQF